MTLSNAFNGIFKDKTVLVTGHTGFIGSWLTEWLCELQANVIGYSLEPPTSPSLFSALNLEKKISHNIGDINDSKKLQNTIEKHSPEIIFHLAAQSSVPLSFKNFSGIRLNYAFCDRNFSIFSHYTAFGDFCDYFFDFWFWCFDVGKSFSLGALLYVAPSTLSESE